MVGIWLMITNELCQVISTLMDKIKISINSLPMNSVIRINKMQNFTRSFLLLTVILATAIFFSCNSSKYEDELNKIDSLIVINENIGMMMAEGDTALALEARAEFAKNWKIIQEVVESIEDVEMIRENEYWPYITNYEAKDRALKKLIRKYKSMDNARRENEIQLSDLHNSVRRNQIPADSIEMYINMESIAVYNLEHDVNMYLPEFINTLHLLDSLHQYTPDAVNSYRVLLDKSKK